MSCNEERCQHCGAFAAIRSDLEHLLKEMAGENPVQAHLLPGFVVPESFKERAQRVLLGWVEKGNCENGYRGLLAAKRSLYVAVCEHILAITESYLSEVEAMPARMDAAERARTTIRSTRTMLDDHRRQIQRNEEAFSPYTLAVDLVLVENAMREARTQLEGWKRDQRVMHRRTEAAHLLQLVTR